jgi:hypothetical protein
VAFARFLPLEVDVLGPFVWVRADTGDIWALPGEYVPLVGHLIADDDRFVCLDADIDPVRLPGRKRVAGVLTGTRRRNRLAIGVPFREVPVGHPLEDR